MMGFVGMVKVCKVEVVIGVGVFVDLFYMEVQGENGKKVVKFKQVIIVVGLQVVKLLFMLEDLCVVDLMGVFELC